MKASSLLPTLLFLIFIPAALFSQDGPFFRNMKLGDTGGDVLALQRLLNEGADTALAAGGAGSRGYETGYFGTLTLEAVKRFQEKYRDEILTPQNLLTGTGYAGALTLKKLNSLAVAPAVPAQKVQNEASKAQFNVTNFIKPPKVFSVSPLFAKPGEKIEIRGEWFTDGNSIYLDDRKILSVVPRQGEVISFELPADIGLGNYNLWIENERGSTKNQIKGKFFTVSDETIYPPKIDTLSQDRISISDVRKTLTIKGTNFELSNEVYSSLGSLVGVAAVAEETINFSISDLEGIGQISEFLKKYPDHAVDIYISVKNKYGISLPKKITIF